ncbi:amidohydrolase [Vallitalea longa]|uniref:Amidohydrolase n=1 Tax=Vallitalea longa TaxID=2936439 RepID=A0A9W5YA05_9FIRM|nr:nitrilase-related carbon-nitrogen hydrolase [Vallitalea longa]GKX29637.1 amidohydrolase [Vallitalea longa]
MKIAMVQTKPVINEMESNFRTILSFIEEAIEQNVELICFPEMALCGYTFENLEWQVTKHKSYIERLRIEANKNNITIVIGGIEKLLDEYYLAQFVIDEDIDSYHKIHIGNKERCFVTAGEEIKVFKKNDLIFGIMMCYDTHFPELSTYMALSGANLILAPSAVPNDSSKRVDSWKKYLVARAYDNRVYVAANNLIFDNGGGGMICYDPNGDMIECDRGNDESMLIFEVEKGNYSKTSMKKRDFKLDRKPELYEKWSCKTK